MHACICICIYICICICKRFCHEDASANRIGIVTAATSWDIPSCESFGVVWYVVCRMQSPSDLQARRDEARRCETTIHFNSFHYSDSHWSRFPTLAIIATYCSPPAAVIDGGYEREFESSTKDFASNDA
jgi:hypothetical protein